VPCRVSATTHFQSSLAWRKHRLTRSSRYGRDADNARPRTRGGGPGGPSSKCRSWRTFSVGRDVRVARPIPLRGRPSSASSKCRSMALAIAGTPRTGLSASHTYPRGWRAKRRQPTRPARCLLQAPRPTTSTRATCRSVRPASAEAATFGRDVRLRASAPERSVARPFNSESQVGLVMGTYCYRRRRLLI
jgi:hypothetical protein